VDGSGKVVIIEEREREADAKGAGKLISQGDSLFFADQIATRRYGD